MTDRKHNYWFKAAGSFLFLLFLVSCGNSKKYIIPERKFVSVLVDLHLAEAIGIESRRNLDITYVVDSASLYGSVFQKHRVTKAMFDSTLFYYSQRPEKFQKLYNAVTANLKHMEQDLEEEIRQKELAETEVLFKTDSVYLFPQLGADRIYIDVPIKGAGIYTVSATIKMLPDDGSLDPRMSVYFYRDDSTADGQKINFQEVRYATRTGEEKTYRAARRILTSEFTHLRGYIANYSNNDTVFHRNMVIKDLMVTRKNPDDNPPATP